MFSRSSAALPRRRVCCGAAPTLCHGGTRSYPTVLWWVSPDPVLIAYLPLTYKLLLQLLASMQVALQSIVVSKRLFV